MQKLEMSKGLNKKLRLHGLHKGDRESLKLRRGKVQGYKDYLSPATVEDARKVATRYDFEI